MVDVRWSADRAALADRGSLEACDISDLLQLAEGDSSSGTTTCTPVLEDSDGLRNATAEWSNVGGTAFQPETRFPEPGLLKWNADGSIMTERAPSGDYLEQWNRVRGTEGVTGRIEDRSATQKLFVLGPVAVFVDDRRQGVPRYGRLPDLVKASSEDLNRASDLVDCEFSLAQRTDTDRFRIVSSTHPWRIGDELDVAV